MIRRSQFIRREQVAAPSNKIFGLFIFLFLMVCVTHCFMDFPLVLNNEQVHKEYPANPLYAMVDTARSLATSGQFPSEKYERIHQHLLAWSEEQPGQSIVQDLYAFSKDGQWLPKHPILPAVIAAGFYFVGGDVGIRVMISLQFTLLFLVVFMLADTRGGRRAVWWSLLALLVSVPFWASSLIAFSYDLQALVFILWGGYFMSRYPMLGGFLVALAFGARITNIVWIPLMFVIFGLSASRSGFIRYWAGAATTVCGLVSINYFLYGHWGGGYASAPAYIGGEMVNSYGSHYFSLDLLREHWRGRLLSGETSILRMYPGLLVSVPVIIYGLFTKKIRGRMGLEDWTLIGSCVANIVLFASFSYWESSAGARFVMLPVCLLILYAGMLISGKELPAKSRH